MAFNKIYAIVASRGQGKTPLIRGGKYEQGLAKVFLNKGMSVLILDTLDHPAYRDIPTLHPDNYNLLSEKPGIYRTLANRDDMQEVIKKLKDVWNTFIVFEDAYKYIGNQLNKDFRTVIADSKQQNNDLAFMFSCWKWVPDDLVRQTNYYSVFKTADSPEEKKHCMGGCYQEVLQAYELIMSGKLENKKPYITVDSGI